MRNWFWILPMLAVAVLGGCNKNKPRQLVMENPPPVVPELPIGEIPPGRVVAAGMLQVGQRFVTAEMVLVKGRDAFKMMADETEESAFRRKAMPVVSRLIQACIAESLVLTEADRELPEQARKIIDAQVKLRRQGLVTGAGGNEDVLLHELAQEGTRIENILEDYRRRLTISAYLRHKVVPEMEIDRSMLWKYYQMHRDKYVVGKKVTLRVIAVPYQMVEGGKSQAIQMASDAVADLKAGKDFAEVAKMLAKTISSPHGKEWNGMRSFGKAYVNQMAANGGLGTEISPDSIADEALAAAADKLQEGQTSDVVLSGRSCYVVRVHSLRPAKHVSFAEAQGTIERLLRTRYVNNLRETYVNGLTMEFDKLCGTRGKAMMEQLVSITLDCAVDKFWRKSGVTSVATPTAAGSTPATQGTSAQ